MLRKQPETTNKRGTASPEQFKTDANKRNLVEESALDKMEAAGTGASTTSKSEEAGTTDLTSETTSSGVDNIDLIQDLQDEDVHDLMNLDEDSDGVDEISISSSAIEDIFTRAYGPPVNTEHPTANERYNDIDRAPPGFLDNDMYDDGNDYDDFDEDDEDQDGGNVDFEFYDDDDDEGYGGFEEEFGDEYDDEDDYEGEEDMFDDEEGPMYPDRRSAETEFGGVEMIHPRRMFRGAKNVETVKDCTSRPILSYSNTR